MNPVFAPVAVRATLAAVRDPPAEYFRPIFRDPAPTGMAANRTGYFRGDFAILDSPCGKFMVF